MNCAPKVGHKKNKNMKYNPTVAVQLSEQVVKGVQSVYGVCRQYPSLDEKELRVWCALYQEYGAYVFSEEREFDVTLQKRIVEDKLQSGLSIRQTCVKYQITSRSRLRNWIRAYKTGRMENKKRNKKAKPLSNDTDISTSERIKKLERELLFVKAENAYLKKLRALMQETKKNG